MDEPENVAIPDTLILTLTPPVDIGGATCREVRLQEPTLVQIQRAHEKLDNAGMSSVRAQRAYELTLLQHVSKLSPAVIDALPARKIREGIQYLERFVTCDLPAQEWDGEDIPDEVIVPLDAPLTANGLEVSELALREPTGGELAKAEALLGSAMPPLPGPIRAYHLRLICEVTGLKPGHIGQVPIRKAREAVRYLEGFERSVPTTGANSGLT